MDFDEFSGRRISESTVSKVTVSTLTDSIRSLKRELLWKTWWRCTVKTLHPMQMCLIRAASASQPSRSLSMTKLLREFNLKEPWSISSQELLGPSNQWSNPRSNQTWLPCQKGKRWIRSRSRQIRDSTKLNEVWAKERLDKVLPLTLKTLKSRSLRILSLPNSRKANHVTKS